MVERSRAGALDNLGRAYLFQSFGDVVRELGALNDELVKVLAGVFRHD